MSMKNNKLPGLGDIWLVHFPYITPGNMEKLRPAIITDFDGEDRVIVQKLTTKRKKNNKEFNHQKKKRKTYISSDKMSISDYNLVRYIGRANIK